MFNNFLEPILNLNDTLKVVLGTSFISLLLIAGIIVMLFIRNQMKKNSVLRDLDIEERFLDIRALVSLRFRGRIPVEEFNKKKNELFLKDGLIGKLLERINSFDFLRGYLASLDRLDECVIVTSDGGVKYANEKFTKLLGYSRREIKSSTVLDIIHPNDLNSFNYYQAGTDNGSYSDSNNIIRLVTKDGETRWFEIYTISISKENQYITFLKDITKIALTENELIDTLNRYHVLFDYSPMPIVELDISTLNENINELKDLGIDDFKAFFDLNFKLLFNWINDLKVINANRAIYGFFNLAEKMDITKTLLKFLREELKDIFFEIIEKISAGELTHESEFTFTDSSKKEKHVILKFAIIQNNGKKNSRALLSFTDITEQKSMINEIQNLSMFQESVIYNANIWLSVYDRDLNVMVWNKAAELISGYKKKEVLNNNRIWKKLYPDEKTKEEVIRKIKNIAVSDNNGDIEEFETSIKGKNNREKIILWNAKKFTDEEGSEIGLIIIGYDYTDKRRMENKLKHVATHDALTNLYNRAFFEEQLNLMFEERDSKVGIIVLDIDGLKYVNDTLGHQEGDKLITNVAKILNKTFRPSDIVSRIGGDEFSVLLRNIDEEKIEKILERLKERIDEYNYNKKATKYPMNISFGYAIRDNGKSAVQIFKKADDMLFSKKINRKDTVIKSALSAIKATMLEKDSITEEHMERLKEIANKFADSVELDLDDKRKLILATELHDIGKVIVSDDILKKPSTLNKEEFEIIKRHSESGYRIAKLTPTIKHVSEFILHSHERWDGKGYPNKLKGNQIPLLSRMMHIIDAFDVMINHRPYKKAMTEESAIKELKKCSGTQFDPELVEIFIEDVLKSTSEKELVRSRA
jgi:diguanylate cyclase (GGDEF)-like protein/PAS domain S-box-containing protein